MFKKKFLPKKAKSTYKKSKSKQLRITTIKKNAKNKKMSKSWDNPPHPVMKIHNIFLNESFPQSNNVK